MLERGVAGAEVVEHQPHAEVLEVLQHGGRRGGLLHQHALGQLEPEPLGRHPGLAQDARELVGQRGLGELASGQVDGQAREVDRGVGGPARELAAGLAQHPAPERHDQPALLGDRDERAREHDPLLRVAPAHQRLDGDDPALVEVDERLVVELELVVVERAAQVLLELEALHHAPAHAAVEQLEARAAAVLGAIHGDVGVAHDRLGGVVGAVGDDDADRRVTITERSPIAIGAARASSSRWATSIAPRSPGRPSHSSANSSPTMRASVSLAAATGREPLSHLGEQVVAALVAERVVDELEAVDVEHEHGDRAAVASGERERVVDAVDEQRAVRQAGQRVVHRAVLGLLLEGDHAPQRVVEAGRGGDGPGCSEPVGASMATSGSSWSISAQNASTTIGSNW